MLTQNETSQTISREIGEPNLKTAIQQLCADYSTEVTPAAMGKVQNLSDFLSPGTDVYITSLPGGDYLETVSVAARLRKEGFNPVPHFAARSITDMAMLNDFVERAAGEAGVDTALLIAGALDKPCGEFSDTTHLLRTGVLEKNGIETVGVAGHPESCACCSEAELWAALAWKQEYSRRVGLDARIVTQFAFEADPFIEYDRALIDKGFDLPLHVGVPGIANLKTLINFAMSCGVGNSIEFLRKQAKNVTKLLKPSAPDKLLLDLAIYKSKQGSDTSIDKLHLFPLGGIKKTARWTNAVRDGNFEVKQDLSGLVVDVDYG